MARTRSESVDQAIVAATLAVIADRGIEGFSVEEVASRAAVGKATIYRRYADRNELINASLAKLSDDLPAINEKSSAVDALIEMLEWLRTSRSFGAELLPRIFAQAKSNPELYELCHAKVVLPRLERVYEVLRMGIDTGELRADLDVEIAGSMLVSPVLLFNMLHQHGNQATRRDYVDRLVRHALTGVAAESAERLEKRRGAFRSSRRLRKVLSSD